MSKRGRRRSSRRRKSSSSSKQSVSPYIFNKQNNRNSISYKDDIVEKGETDSFRKENVLSGSEDEEKYSDAPPKEKKFKQDYQVNSFPKQRTIYRKATENKEKGVKTVTLVSVHDVEGTSPKIMFQQSHEPLSENPADTSAPVNNIMKIDCSGSHLKLEIQGFLQSNTCGVKTTLVFTNERNSAETFLDKKCQRPWMPNNESSEQPSQKVYGHDGNQSRSYTFTFGSVSEQTEAQLSSAATWDIADSAQYCSDQKTDFMLANHPSLNIKAQEKRKCFRKSFSTDIPPPQEFADFKYNSLEDLTHGLASCRIGACRPADKWQREFHPTLNISSEKESGFSVEVKERAELSPSFDQLSESDNYDLVLLRASLSTNTSSFTKDFINYQKRKSWFRKNSVATAEHRACLIPRKRRQTFPWMSQRLGPMQGDLLLPCTESVSSSITSLFPLQTEGSGNIPQGHFFALGTRNLMSLNKESSTTVSEIPNSYDDKQTSVSPFYMTSTEEHPGGMFTDTEESLRQSSITYFNLRKQDRDLEQSINKHIESHDIDDCGYKVDQSDVADSGINQEMGQVEYHSPELGQRALAIQVIPPSHSGSEEQMLQSHPVISAQNNTVGNTSLDNLVLPKHGKSSVTSITVGALEQRFLQLDSRPSPGRCTGNHARPALEKPHLFSLQNTKEDSEKIEKTPDLPMNTEDSDKPSATASHPTKDTGGHCKEQHRKADKTEKQTATRSPLDSKEHLKPVVHKEPDISNSDQWSRRRKLFKESKQWSSAGGSSMTSDITEESVSEDTRSMDMTIRDSEDRGFYTETFHSSAWIYQGDDVGSGAIPPILNSRNRAVSIRERTVKVCKGTGEYPWGFRIQFSKPIVVTEVDTNGAAEEAGLIVGDYVLAVNGTDVTSIPHSEAAELARQGPDLLTLTIGSDIARCPNTPRPACRGYLHKRTQSGLIKGWRKRWFVLTHDCCLYYYRHKRDEGKRRPLTAFKLEAAEVGADVSLGKPFVFRCCPQAGNRVYFFCATSNQEMKRWLEAMEKAVHPITQTHVWEDVTRHNSNLPPLAVKNPECLGLLHKLDKNKDMWVQHYCILKDGCLSWYSGIRATHAHGGIYLQGYMVREQPYSSKKSTIELKPLSDEFKTFYFCAENPTENKRWILAIKASLQTWLPLHKALQDYMSQPSEETRM